MVPVAKVLSIGTSYFGLPFDCGTALGSIAVTSGLVVNVMLRVTIIFKQFGDKSFESDSQSTFFENLF